MYVYFGVSIPLLEKLDTEFNQSRNLLKIIPPSIRIALHLRGQEERANQVDEEIIDTSDQRRRFAALHRVAMRKRGFPLFGIMTGSKFQCLLLCAAIGWAVWFYMATAMGVDYINLISKHGAIVLTMVFGAFIAGSTAMGSGSVAFAVFSALDVNSTVSRDFSFSIQVMGMGLASVWLYLTGTVIEPDIIKFSSLGGFCGTILSTFALDGVLPPSVVKILLNSVWFGFGLTIALTTIVFNSKQEYAIANLNGSTKIDLILIGFIGGAISGLSGSGADLFVFSMTTIYFRIDESVGVPTSVIVCDRTLPSANACFS